jgi:Cu-Zn family superoxide dismutase
MTPFRKIIVLACTLLILALPSCGPKKKVAKAMIQSASGSSLTGEATFEESAGKVKMTLTVQGATPGTHAVHLYENGDCSANDATSAGGHWNPTHESHGKRAGDGAFHSGDIANLEVGADGTGNLEVSASNWTIGGAPETDVIGKAVIIHATADDFVSQPSGNAGAREGCGVVSQTE